MKTKLTHNEIKASITGVLPLIEERAYTEKEAAEILGVSIKTLQAWRFQGKTELPYCKIGRGVRYFGPDIRAFIDRCRIEAV